MRRSSQRPKSSACFALAIGTPVYAYLKLRWCAEATEKRAWSEQLGPLAAEAELEQTVAALNAADQRTVRELHDGVGPLDNPPSGIVPMLRWAAEHAPADPYFVAFGWEHVRGTPTLAGISLHGDSAVKATHGLLKHGLDTRRGRNAISPGEARLCRSGLFTSLTASWKHYITLKVS